jgi:hypothetical protein
MSIEASEDVSNFLSRLDGVRKSGPGWIARCPCRSDDESPSLSIAQSKQGKVLVTCHRGTNPCDFAHIMKAAGVKPKGTLNEMKSELRLVATYDYWDSDGTLLFQKLRYVDESGRKTFRQRKPDGAGGWLHSLGDTPRVLYNLPSVISAVQSGEKVYVVEGEKDADTLIALGKVATTCPNGAGSWFPIHTDVLAGAKVEVVADNDEPGREHAFQVKEALEAAGSAVRLWVTPRGKDISDFLGAGGELGQMVRLDKEQVDSPEPEVVDDGVTDVLGQIADVFDDEELSFQQKLNRAASLLGSLRADLPVDEGRLVEWANLVDEAESDSYDWVIPGLLERQERVIVVAAEGVGKRATIDSVIPTPSGWTTLGDICVGDVVIDRFGNPVNVTHVSPVEFNPDAYRVTFSDGNYIDADAEHQWYTETLNEREKRKLGGVRTTKQILDTLISDRKSKAFNHAIPATKPLNLPEAKLPIPPYTLGAWLGDGTTIGGSICSEDDEILEEIRNDGYVVRKRESTTNMYGILGLQAQLREHGLYGNKHIPAIYSRASYEQRLSIVQGLMDTDGYVRSDGLCEFSVNHRELAKGFLDIILTLGIKATMRESDSKLYGKVTGTRYRISFKTDLPVCRLKRKVDRLPKKLKTPRSLYRYIVSVEPINPVPMRCISVDGPDNTYLIGDAYIPTHNSMLARQVAILTAHGINPFSFNHMPPIRTLYVDLENPERIIRRSGRPIIAAVKQYSHVQHAEAHVVVKPSGFDLLKEADRQVLEKHVQSVRPDIMFMGPLYKAYVDGGGRTPEAIAVEVVKYLDYLRDVYGCALWLEHHAPLGSSIATRDLRPFGSAVWSRWPEFGLSLTPDPTSEEGYVYNVQHFRGEREPRQWPVRMKRGTLFPFEVLEFRKET